MKFLSNEWVSQYIESLNQDENFKRITRKWEDNILFFFQEKDSMESKGILLTIHHGVCKEGKIVSDVEEVPMTIIGSMANWKILFQGKISFFNLIIEQKLRMKGDVDKIMRNLPAINAMVNKIIEITEVEE